jgi:4-carboxymuconolactone decarboxylase
METYRRLFGRDRAEPANAFEELTVDHLFARVWTREGLSMRDRSLVTVSVLAALGREHELRTHVRGLRSQGFGDREITELMIHVAHYAGWPAGNTGLRIAREASAP